jgi:hypothetical protein
METVPESSTVISLQSTTPTVPEETTAPYEETTLSDILMKQAKDFQKKIGSIFGDPEEDTEVEAPVTDKAKINPEQTTLVSMSVSTSESIVSTTISTSQAV